MIDTSNNNSIVQHNELISKPINLYPVPSSIIQKTVKSNHRNTTVTTIIPHRWTRHSHVSRVEHRIKPIHCHSGVDYTPPAYAASRNLSQKRGTEPIYPYVQYGSFQIGCWRRSVLNEKGSPCLGVQSFWRVAKGEQEIWKIEQSSSRGQGRSMVNLDESIFASWKKEKEKKNGSATWRFVKRLFKG